MSESTAFPDFIRRIRASDDQAARELVERYEPVIRCEVRLRLRDPRLYSRFDCDKRVGPFCSARPSCSARAQLSVVGAIGIPPA
jgi:hypothetical protein